MKQNPSAHPFDANIGRRIRAHRLKAGVSQQALAKTLGITHQQVQRYESAASRIYASRLLAIAIALGVPVARFYESDDARG